MLFISERTLLSISAFISTCHMGAHLQMLVELNKIHFHARLYLVIILISPTLSKWHWNNRSKLITIVMGSLQWCLGKNTYLHLSSLKVNKLKRLQMYTGIGWLSKWMAEGKNQVSHCWYEILQISKGKRLEYLSDSRLKLETPVWNHI
jgi:hypothetical protein